MPFLGIDHVDLRVRSLAEALPFYERLLPALGLAFGPVYAYVDADNEWHDAMPERRNAAEWYEPEHEVAAGRPRAFFGVIEDPAHVATRTCVAFAAGSRHEVERLARELPSFGARELEVWDRGDYVAVFFVDPCGNRLEIAARKPRL